MAKWVPGGGGFADSIGTRQSTRLRDTESSSNRKSLLRTGTRLTLVSLRTGRQKDTQRAWIRRRGQTEHSRRLTGSMVRPSCLHDRHADRA